MSSSLLGNLKTESTIEKSSPAEPEISGEKQIQVDEELTGLTKQTISPVPEKEVLPRGQGILTSDESMWVFPTRRLSAENIRSINRAVTQKIPNEIEEDLLRERNELVRKKIKQGLSKKEERRLTYLRWQLDRIDDARFGEQLDNLEMMASAQEEFAKELRFFLSEIGVESKNGR
jgi:hypothetical protein